MLSCPVINLARSLFLVRLMSHRANVKHPEPEPEADQPVSNANIDTALKYDKKYARAFREVDTDGDSKISDAEVKALLTKNTCMRDSRKRWHSRTY